MRNKSNSGNVFVKSEFNDRRVRVVASGTEGHSWILFRRSLSLVELNGASHKGKGYKLRIYRYSYTGHRNWTFDRELFAEWLRGVVVRYSWCHAFPVVVVSCVGGQGSSRYVTAQQMERTLVPNSS